MMTYLSDTLNDAVSHGMDPALSTVLSTLAQCCQTIGAKVAKGALAGILGNAGSENIQGEDQKKLDIIANDLLIDALSNSGVIAAMASEELDDINVVAGCENAPYLVLFDPLDGSSNIDVNVSIGTIFSILKRPNGPLNQNSFLQTGRAQIAAGYVIYGPQTQLVLSTGKGVDAYTFGTDTNQFTLTNANIQISEQTKEFAINMSNMRHWFAPVKQYIDELLAGKTGCREKDFNMRWIASMVADVHRIMTRGGIFMYPADARDPDKPGKLRLMYEANPMAFLIEQAGGLASNGKQAILDITPEKLHQRCAVILGSKQEVNRVVALHAESNP